MSTNAERPGIEPLALELAIDIAPEFVASVQQSFLEQIVACTLESEEVRGPVELSIVITDDAAVQELNRTYRGIDRPTDVLSFPQEEPGEEILRAPEQPRLLGDVVISFNRVEEQAREYGHSVDRELAYLTAHGILHLLGYDHEADEERQVMRAHEERALADIPRG